MIKLCFEDKTLKDLDAQLLPYVQWKSLNVSDMEGVPNEVLSQYVLKMSKSVMKSLVKSKRVNLSNLTVQQWFEIVDYAYFESFEIFDYIQLPYDVIMVILNDRTRTNRIASILARTQRQMPVELVVKYISTSDINSILRSGSNPALVDYIFTEEGMKVLKQKHNINNLVYLTSEEAKKLGLKRKNRNINVAILRRAGACDAGISYCTKMLKELEVNSITWDNAINTIRSNKKYHNRSSLFEYMSWIAARRESLDRIDS